MQTQHHAAPDFRSPGCLFSPRKITFCHFRSCFTWVVADGEPAAVKNLNCYPTYKLTGSPAIILPLYLNQSASLFASVRLSSLSRSIKMTSQGQGTELPYRTVVQNSYRTSVPEALILHGMLICTCTWGCLRTGEEPPNYETWN